MRNSGRTFILTIALAIGAMSSTPTIAATAGEVMQACDKVADGGGSCDYKVNPEGDVYGCAQAKGSSKKTCFVCPKGGECGGGREQTGGWNHGRAAQGNTTLPTAPTDPAPPSGAGVRKPLGPAAGTLKQH